MRGALLCSKFVTYRVWNAGRSIGNFLSLWPKVKNYLVCFTCGLGDFLDRIFVGNVENFYPPTRYLNRMIMEIAILRNEWNFFACKFFPDKIFHTN